MPVSAIPAAAPTQIALLLRGKRRVARCSLAAPESVDDCPTRWAGGASVSILATSSVIASGCADESDACCGGSDGFAGTNGASSSASSFIDCGRAEGSLARQRSMILSSLRAMGSTFRTFGGGSNR